MMPRLNNWVGRRHAVANEESKYQQRVKGFSSSASLTDGGGKSGFMCRPPPLKTSSTFDNDDAFAAVAGAMLYRYENEGQSERDAVHATLISSAERRAFLEALDIRNVQIYASEHQSELEENTLHQLVQRTTDIFATTLRDMWRESATCESELNDMDSACDRNNASDTSGSKYRKPPPSPKHVLQSRSSSLSTHSSGSRSGVHSRRRFFPDSDSSRRCRTRVRFDWKRPTPEPVKSLHLDEHPPTPPRVSKYEPPSPIESTFRRLTH